MSLIHDFNDIDTLKCRQNGLPAVPAVFAVAGSHRLCVCGEYQIDNCFFLQDANLPL